MNACILVVDDEIAICNMLIAFFSSQGYTVDGAKDVPTAQNLLEQNAYDVLLVDKNMPGIDNNCEGGMDLLRYIRNNALSTEVIVMTGFATIETAIESMRLGAFDYIQKPFSLESLKDKVSRLIEYRQFINPDNMLTIYRSIRGEMLSLLEKRSKMTDDELNIAIISINLEMDKIFKLFKQNERMILFLRESLAKVASMAERLKTGAQENGAAEELLNEISRVAGMNL